MGCVALPMSQLAAHGVVLASLIDGQLTNRVT